jgi:hypothetical protein
MQREHGSLATVAQHLVGATGRGGDAAGAWAAVYIAAIAGGTLNKSKARIQIGTGDAARSGKASATDVSEAAIDAAADVTGARLAAGDLAAAGPIVASHFAFTGATAHEVVTALLAADRTALWKLGSFSTFDAAASAAAAIDFAKAAAVARDAAEAGSETGTLQGVHVCPQVDQRAAAAWAAALYVTAAIGVAAVDLARAAESTVAAHREWAGNID